MIEVVTINKEKKRKSNPVNSAMIVSIILSLVLLSSDILFKINYALDTYLIITLINYYYFLGRFENLNK